jgi:hypothetical protein
LLPKWKTLDCDAKQNNCVSGPGGNVLIPSASGQMLLRLFCLTPIHRIKALRSIELRCALSLAWLWHSQGRNLAARQIPSLPTKRVPNRSPAHQFATEGSVSAPESVVQ